MRIDLPDHDDPRRIAIRGWLADHPQPTGRQLAAAGYVAPHWPAPYGLDADAVEQLLIDEELRAAKIRRPENLIGIGWAGPTILHAGTEAQQERYLPPILSGEEIWCQLFSEPGSGSDLAGLQTRAVRDGDEYVVNGQKVWSSLAHKSQYGILLARTDPDAQKQHGISYFICPMNLPGVEIRPIVDLTGDHTFNEVFFTDVRIPAANLIGVENDGWRLAKVTLGNERVSLSGRGALWGHGPTTDTLLRTARARGRVDDPVVRQRLARLYIDERILELLRSRQIAAAISGAQPGPEASLRKLFADEHGQRLMRTAKDLTGAAGMVVGGEPFDGPPGIWSGGFLFSIALTIGGGTSEVQRNIIAERLLGLPQDEPGAAVGSLA